MTTHALGPWPKGLDNVSSQTIGTPNDCLTVAQDVFIDRDGSVDSWPGLSLASSIGQVRAVYAGRFGQYAAGDQITDLVTGEALDGIPSGACAFAEHNDQLLLVDSAGVHTVGEAGLSVYGLPAPVFAVEPDSAGGLEAGSYAVALSILRNGKEGALSGAKWVSVDAGGGLRFDLPDGDFDAVRIYRSGANGGDLYRVLDAPPGAIGFLVGAGKLGAMASTRNLEPLPGGHLIASWSGRVLVGSGRYLYFSEPLRPDLFDRRHNFITFKSRLRMIAPVADGCYVADGDGVYFLAGTSPADWTLRRIDSEPPPAGCFTVCDGAIFPEIPDVRVAVWLTRRGFAIGLPEGQAVHPQADRLALQLSGSGQLVAVGRRLFALTY